MIHQCEGVPKGSYCPAGLPTASEILWSDGLCVTGDYAPAPLPEGSAWLAVRPGGVDRPGSRPSRLLAHRAAREYDEEDIGALSVPLLASKTRPAT